MRGERLVVGVCNLQVLKSKLMEAHNFIFEK
jgi:hypothetical protein